MQGWLKTGDAARELGISPHKVRRLCEADLIEGRRNGSGRWLVAAAEIPRLRKEGIPPLPALQDPDDELEEDEAGEQLDQAEEDTEADERPVKPKPAAAQLDSEYGKYADRVRKERSRSAVLKERLERKRLQEEEAERKRQQAEFEQARRDAERRAEQQRRHLARVDALQVQTLAHYDSTLILKRDRAAFTARLRDALLKLDPLTSDAVCQQVAKDCLSQEVEAGALSFLTDKVLMRMDAAEQTKRVDPVELFATAVKAFTPCFTAPPPPPVPAPALIPPQPVSHRDAGTKADGYLHLIGTYLDRFMREERAEWDRPNERREWVYNLERLIRPQLVERFQQYPKFELNVATFIESEVRRKAKRWLNEES